jgi:hypothetical protein
MDDASRRVWIFLTKSEEHPLPYFLAFMTEFGRANGLIRTDQGGKLARSSVFREIMFKNIGYVVEPTWVDSSFQSAVQKYTTTPWLLRFECSSTAQASPQSSDPPCSSTQLISIMGWYILPLIRLHIKHGQVANQMFPI